MPAKKSHPAVDVLIPQCESRAGLAIVRSLARHGVSFVISCSTRGNIVFWSRYVKCAELMPFEPADRQAFFKANLAIAEKYRVKMIMC